MELFVRFACSSCGKTLKAKPELVGKRVRCSCGGVTRVPAPALSESKAVSAVRAIAEKHKVNGVLKKLGNFNPNYIANARANYAQEMTQAEVPLAMIDTSFLQNGKAGLLLTNRSLYSSSLDDAIPLIVIMNAIVEKPTALEAAFGGEDEPALLVNGIEVHSGRMTEAFWTELLPKLGQCCREEIGSAGTSSVVKAVEAANAPGVAMAVGKSVKAKLVDHPPVREDHARLAAAMVSAGKSSAEILADLSVRGVPRDQALELIQQMVSIRQRPQTGRAALYLVLGLVLFVIDLFPLAGFLYLLIAEGTFAVFGLLIIAVCLPTSLTLLTTGIYRLKTGTAPIRTEQLLEEWEEKHGE